jgi:hypothetical protein
MNNISKYLEFKATMEEKRSINYLDLTITRNTKSIEISIYRKPTSADITIQYTSNHPWEHIKAAYTHYINRAITLPITEQARTRMAEHKQHSSKNCFPTKIIRQMKEKERAKLNKKEIEEQEKHTNNSKKWVTFTYHSPLVRKVTNLFKNTDIRIAFRTNKTIHQQLAQKQ